MSKTLSMQKLTSKIDELQPGLQPQSTFQFNIVLLKQDLRLMSPFLISCELFKKVKKCTTLKINFKF